MSLFKQKNCLHYHEIPALNPKFHYNVVIVFILLTIGAIIRILSCYYGYPYLDLVHPDEHTIVDGAINMISNHSYIAYTYNRPDQFEVKCNVILFQIFSYIKYHMCAHHIINLEPKETFYFIARLYTAFFGVMTIILMYKFVEKIKPEAKIIAAALVTFFPIFVRHSAYATPDVVLAFFVLLVAYYGILYLENGSIKYLVLMCIATGIGITVKYPCAIMCIYIAIVICIQYFNRNQTKKNYSDIIRLGIFSIIIILITCFILSPNLFIKLSKTISALRFEARSTHPGMDGLGFLGNLKYYITTFLNCAGYEALICMLAGVFFFLKNKRKYVYYILPGLIFWVCISVLPRHMERWGTPIYIFFIALIAIGISYLFDLAKLSQKLWIKSTVAILALIVILNSTLSGILLAQYNFSKHTVAIAAQYAEDNGITKQNTLYDRYTIFRPLSIPTLSPKNFSVDDLGNIKFSPEIQYVIKHDWYSAIPNTELERHPNQFRMIYSIDGETYCKPSTRDVINGATYYRSSNKGILNIIYVIQGMLSYKKNMVVGHKISIYRVNE